MKIRLFIESICFVTGCVMAFTVMAFHTDDHRLQAWLEKHWIEGSTEVHTSQLPDALSEKLMAHINEGSPLH